MSSSRVETILHLFAPQVSRAPSFSRSPGLCQKLDEDSAAPLTSFPYGTFPLECYLLPGVIVGAGVAAGAGAAFEISNRFFKTPPSLTATDAW